MFGPLRHFPAKEDLVAAVFLDRMDAYADAVATALDDPDPWHGFTGYIETACAMQAADYGFADVLTMTFPTAKALEQRRNEAYEAMVELIDRAKAAGRLREDFDPSDLVLMHMANAGVVNATGDAAPDAWRRVVALLIQSLEAAAPCPPRPSTTPSTRPCSAPARRAAPHRGRGRAADLGAGNSAPGRAWRQYEGKGAYGGTPAIIRCPPGAQPGMSGFHSSRPHSEPPGG